MIQSILIGFIPILVVFFIPYIVGRIYFIIYPKTFYEFERKDSTMKINENTKIGQIANQTFWIVGAVTLFTIAVVLLLAFWLGGIVQEILL